MSEVKEHIADTIVIGGGASGMLVASQLLRRSGGRHRVAIVEPASELGRGAAYSTPHAAHLLNVVAGRMSAFEDEANDFVDFLAEDSAAPAVTFVHRFAARRDFGRYLRATLARQPGFAQLVVVASAANAVVFNDDAVDVACADGARVRASNLVLAVGNAPKRLASLLPQMDAHSTCVDAWDYAGIAAIDPHHDIAILGSGLSMVDVVVSLAQARHQGCIHVVSRHGLLPLPHAAPGPYAGGIDALLDAPLSERMRLLRTWAAQAQVKGHPWQWVMDRLRPHGAALWRSLDDTAQRRFLRHAVRYWDIHRHRIAPQIHAVIAEALASGQLQVHAGRVLAQTGTPRVDLELALRDGARRTLVVDRLVNATGIEMQVARSSNALLQALLADGAIVPGPYGIGIATDDHGRLRRRDGRIAHNAFTLGSARVGQLWESIAIPELRGQAARIAQSIVARDTAPQVD